MSSSDEEEQEEDLSRPCCRNGENKISSETCDWELRLLRNAHHSFSLAHQNENEILIKKLDGNWTDKIEGRKFLRSFLLRIITSPFVFA